MTTWLRTFWLLAAVSTATAFGNPGAPLKAGENLHYRVSWAIVPGAGDINISAARTSPDELTITTRTSTRRLARLLLPFDAVADSIYDTQTGRLLSLHDISNTRGKHVEHMVRFDYATRTAQYATIGETTSRALPMPEGSPADLITALLETRTWDIKPGDARDSLVIFNDDFYELTIHALRYEDVSTELGTFRALVLEPRMEKTPPKGMFRKGSTVHVWISDDERRLPVKFEVEFNIGTGTATLERYEPPSAAPAPPTPTLPTAPTEPAAAAPPTNAPNPRP